MAEMNPVMQLAYDYLESTNTIIFLTGKAGTGKTTFLQNLRQTTQKKLAVIAPTGVAAINAGGMTIHSFFQLGFGPIVPSGTDRPEVHFNVEKKELLANLELLVIDEVSMVRPDVLDQIDLILRNIKSSQHPFGGVQMLLIGDLSQLSPIIKDDEWAILRPYYNTPYFFSSRVMQKAPYVRIELNHVFRQKEQTFVNILNEVRNNIISEQSLQTLNARHEPGFKPTVEEPYITLTTHNSIAQKINNEYLEALDAREVEYTATVSGDFPRDAYPTDLSLKLKVGAQVMFVKNDTSAEKLYYNGKIGTVTALDDSTVYVQCGTDTKELAVEALEWTNIKYEIDNDEINETNSGSFAQIPLKLAWSITIHKSQGLTFDKAIIDVSESFAHGQAYVALSRCRSLAGMVLRNPISARNIIGDPAVTRFNEQSAKIVPDSARLEQDRQCYQQYLLSELFNFGPLQSKLKEFTSLLPNLEKDIISVAEKFNRQLNAERSQKAATYFLEKLTEAVETLHNNLPFLIDRSKEKAAKADQLIIWLMNRIQLLQYFSANIFTTAVYLEQLKNKITTHDRGYLKALNALPNEELYNQLLAWRETSASLQKIMPGMVFTEKTLAAIAEKLPPTLKAFSGIKGVGPQKANHYGAEIITLIRAFQQGPEHDQVSMF